jgi:hypothetical protein
MKNRPKIISLIINVNLGKRLDLPLKLVKPLHLSYEHTSHPLKYTIELNGLVLFLLHAFLSLQPL